MNSYWVESTNQTNFPKLEKDTKADVCIIGGGITGISLAYKLKNSGLKIAILEKDRIGMGVTANTTAKITSQHDLFYKYLIDTFGKEYAKKYLYANEEAIKDIKNIVDSENIDCDFEWQDSYVYTTKADEILKIEQEGDALKQIGYKDYELLNETPLPFKVLKAIKFKNQAQFHVRKYLLGLANSLKNSNIEIYENSKVIDINKFNNHYNIKTESANVVSKYVVLACHYPIKNFPGEYFLKMYQDRSYVIGVQTNSELPEGMYITSETPSISLRTVKDGDNRLLLVGGQGHKTGDNSVELDNKYDLLEQYIKTVYKDAVVKYKWLAQDCVSLDKVPYIGEFSKIMPNIYVATGYKKWGMTTSHVAAQIISDKILGKKNKYADVFCATRFNPFQNYKEFGNVLKQTGYSLIINKLKIPEETLDNIKPGTGGVVVHDGKKVGAYKNEDGKVYLVKPYCKHLGCELSWNNLEKTWDCPCHGSRYDYKGKLLTNPSVKDLDKC